MPIGASRQAVHSIYHSIHIYDGFRLINPILIIIRALISYTRFIYSFMYSFHILIHVLISYTHSCTHFIYLYVLIVLYQTVLSPVGVQNRDSSSDTLIYAPLYIKSTYIAISCSYQHHFLLCIPINFNQAISTLGTTIKFSDKMWAPNPIKWYMVRF